MSYGENLIQRLSFYGRLVDEITREVIPFKNFKVTLSEDLSEAHYIEDGYFAFSDLKPSIEKYFFQLIAHGYRSRIIKKSLPAGSPVELTFPGEDELYVVIITVENEAEKKVLFDTIPFVKTVPQGSPVYGENGFSTTLAKPLEGEGIGFATLEGDISSLSPGQLLRFVRSNNIIMRPGPYYHFDQDATIAALKFVEDSMPDKPPLASVKCKIQKVNNISIGTITVGSLDINTVTISGKKLLLGSGKDITTYSNERGDGVFIYPADTPITKLKLDITAAGYNPVTEEVTVDPGQRKFYPIELTRI